MNHDVSEAMFDQMLLLVTLSVFPVAASETCTATGSAVPGKCTGTYSTELTVDKAAGRHKHSSPQKETQIF